MKTYRITSWYIFLNYLFLTLATVTLLPFALFVIMAKADLDVFERLPLILIALFFPVYWYQALREFNTIVIQDDGLIIFRSPIREINIALGDITSIKPFFFRQALIIEHAAGKIRMPRHIEGLDDFLQTDSPLSRDTST